MCEINNAMGFNDVMTLSFVEHKPSFELLAHFNLAVQLFLITNHFCKHSLVHCDDVII